MKPGFSLAVSCMAIMLSICSAVITCRSARRMEAIQRPRSQSDTLRSSFTLYQAYYHGKPGQYGVVVSRDLDKTAKTEKLFDPTSTIHRVADTRSRRQLYQWVTMTNSQTN